MSIDLTGSLWEREFALETTNILFLELWDRIEFHASRSKEWKILKTDQAGKVTKATMVVVADELEECGWKRIG